MCTFPHAIRRAVKISDKAEHKSFLQNIFANSAEPCHLGISVGLGSLRGRGEREGDRVRGGEREEGRT